MRRTSEAPEARRRAALPAACILLALAWLSCLFPVAVAAADGKLAKADEEALSQLLFVGYPGEAPPDSLIAWIRERGLGGVKIFGWSGRDTGALAAAIAALQTAAMARDPDEPLLVATDQEGGWIRHVKGSTSESPGAMAIGASGKASDSRQAGAFIGRELLALGITMDFAPVADLATRPDSSIIGVRAFSDDPALVAELASAFAKGLADSGVLATAKHFPGHGDTPYDSHGRLPEIGASRATLDARELVPFRRLIAEGIPAVMSGHIAFPLVTGSGEPASLSATIMSGLLRGELGFRGLAITDDMYMNGSSGEAGIADACRRAILAGNDMLVLSSAPRADGPLWQTLKASMSDDPEFRARVRESAARIRHLKKSKLVPLGRSVLVPDRARARASLPARGAGEFFAGLAARSATRLSPPGTLPFRPEGKILVAGPFQAFLDAGVSVWKQAGTHRFPYLPSKSEIAPALESFNAKLEPGKAVVVCVADQAGLGFAKAAHEAGCHVAILSALSPALLRGVDWADAIVAVYGFSGPSLRAGIDALSGRAGAPGRLPLAIGIP